MEQFTVRIFNDFQIPTSMGTLLFQDLGRLRFESGVDEEISQTIQSGKEFFNYIRTVHPSMLECTPPGTILERMIAEENEKIKKELKEGIITKPPTPTEWENSISSKRDEVLTDIRQDFNNFLFRISVDGTHAGAWSQANNHILGVDAGGVYLMQSSPGPFFDLSRTDFEAWIIVYAEVMSYMLNELIMQSVDAVRYRIVRIYLPDVDPGAAGNLPLLSVLDANGITWTTHPNSPEQEAAGLAKPKHIFLKPERTAADSVQIDLQDKVVNR